MKDKSLAKQAFGLIIGLVVQYMLGMAINLFVAFPASTDPHVRWDFVTHNVWTQLHLLLGTLLVIGATALFVRAVKRHSGAWKLPSGLALLCLLLAWVSGDVFVTTNKDILSYLMSLGFLTAVLSYCWGIYREKAPVRQS